MVEELLGLIDDAPDFKRSASLLLEMSPVKVAVLLLLVWLVANAYVRHLDKKKGAHETSDSIKESGKEAYSRDKKESDK